MRVNIVPLQIFLPQNSVELGRFTTNFEDPEQSFHDPDTPQDLVTSSYHTYPSYRSDNSKSTFYSILKSLTSARFSKGINPTGHIATGEIRTYCLQDLDAWFNEVTRLPATLAWIKQSIERGHEIYLIVRFHTIKDVSIRQEVRSIVGPAETPASSPVAAGEQVWAIEYRHIHHALRPSKHIDKSPLSDVSQEPSMERVRDGKDGEEEEEGVMELGLEDMDDLNGDWDRHIVEDEIIFVHSSITTRSAGPWFLVPYPENNAFIGRTQILERLQQSRSKSDPQTRVSLLGLGGIGKTHIALKYAYWLRTAYKNISVFWIHAGSAEQFRQSYASVARECRIPGFEDPKTDVLLSVKNWLTDRKQAGYWLMIIDGADDEELFFPSSKELTDTSGVSSGGLGCYIPECAHGSILVTTRNRQNGVRLTGGKSPIWVGKMDDIESEGLLLAQLNDTSVARADLLMLSSQLAYLPLALTQAAAYIKRTSTTITEYIHQLNDVNKDMVELYAKWDSYVPAILVDVWMVSFGQVERQHPLASELFSFMSLLDCEGIQARFMSHYGKQKWKGQGRSDLDVQKALGVLKEYEFVIEEDSGSFVMHRLFQQLTRDLLDSRGTIDPFRRDALMTVSYMFPYGTFETRATCAALLSHANAVLEFSEAALDDEAEAKASLLYCMAGYFDFEGYWKHAESLGLEATKIRKVILGVDHPDTLRSMDSLASIYRNQGRLREAEKLEVQVLETRKVKLGADSPDALASMANLALTYSDQGRWWEAEKLQVRVIEASERILGPEHLDTLSIMANLASTYNKQGRWNEAEELQVRVMGASERIFGPEHPNTLRNIANLASTYYKQGRWNGAQGLQVRVMGASERILGPEHPDTLRNIANLASTYYKQERWDEAEGLLVRVMEANERILGPEHPYTLRNIANVASTYYKQGRWDEAEGLQLRVVEASERIIGPEHPDTLSIMANLASIYGKQGRWDEAEGLQVRVVETSERTLGTEHPDTLRIMASLASTYEKQERWDEARELQGRIRVARREMGADYLLDTSESQPMHPDNDSGYASARRVETLSAPSEPLSAVERRMEILSDPSELLSAVERRMETLSAPSESLSAAEKNHDAFQSSEEILSLASDNDDICSQASVETTNEEMTGKALIRKFLADDPQFRALCEKALAILSRERFLENMRRLLKSFYKNLSEEAQTEAQKATARLLRSRRGRLRIGNQLALYFQPEEEEEELKKPDLEIDLGSKQRVELWVGSVVGRPVDLEQEHDDQNMGDEPWTSSSEDESSSEDDFPFISELGAFLRESKSFQRLRKEFMLLFLPSFVRHVLLSIPREHIWVSHEQDLSLLNRAKAWVEEKTLQKWYWWPFTPPKRMLRQGEARVFWQCTCGSYLWQEVSVEQGELVEKILADSDEQPELPHGCIPKREGMLMARWLGRIFSQTRPASSAAGSSAAQKYTPSANTAATSHSSRHPASSQGGITSGAAAQGSNRPSGHHPFSSTNQQIQIPILATTALPESWILFGVHRGSRMLVPSQIPVTSQATDYSVFQELRRCYYLHRGWLRLWFSIWRLEYCESVKFYRLSLGSMVRDRRELPVDQDYQYRPRPPAADADNPPITPHIFQSLFYTCPSPCTRRVPHECIPSREGSTQLERIPKRRQSFESDMAEDAWGLEAVFEPCVARVLVYHLVILVVPFVFWVWWLAMHQNDWQDAAVPMTIALGGLSMFWSCAGFLTSREHNRK